MIGQAGHSPGVAKETTGNNGRDWLIKTVCGCLADRGVTVATLTSAIQHSLHPLLNSLTANLSQFSSLLSIFQYLKEQQLCNPLDTDLLVYILHNSLQQIDLYEEVLGYWRRIDHIQINCSECRFMQATVTSTEFLYMMAHHPSLTIAVRDVRKMKEFLANHLNLPRHVFWFCGSRVGSLITVWQFSGSYSKELQSFLDNTSALQSLNPPVPLPSEYSSKEIENIPTSQSVILIQTDLLLCNQSWLAS